MTDITLNPFRPTRWEHHRDGRPLIWFTATAEKLCGDKSAYVYGSRGSGKTTLLKGICWEDLSHNESLRLQRRLADFPHIGIYIRFPDHVSASMGVEDLAVLFPNAADARLEYHRFFSLAVELICAERTLEACHALRLIESLVFQPNQELRIVEEFTQEYPEFLNFSPQRPKTFLDLARNLRSVVRRMNEACGRGTILKLLDELPAREPNQLLSFITEYIADVVRVRSQFGERPTTFKFCLDDCEVLSSLQRKTLNTLVRLGRSPISWVISSVGDAYDDSETYIETQPLTDADRRVVSLDERASDDFRDLCQSVVSLRLLFSLPPERRADVAAEKVASFFNLDRRLGNLDVDDMMGLLIKRSSGPFAKQVKSAAERLLRAIRRASPKAARKYQYGRLPLYQAYILLHWRGREEAFKSHFTIDDVDRLDDYGTRSLEPAFQAWLRRKQQNALLHFAASIRSRVPLAGANTVVSLADGSIRDFLEIMGEIYEAWVRNLKLDRAAVSTFERFATATSKIGVPVQANGIYGASATYFAGISHRSEIDADVISRLVGGLGHLTAQLQSNPSDPRVFGATERGVYVISYQGSDAFREQGAFAAIRQAVLAGYLRPIETPKAIRAAQPAGVSRAIAFRLHRRFAPQFRFSFRGAYEVVRLTSLEIADLCFDADAGSPFAWAKVIAGTAGKFGGPQISLPLMEHDDVA